MTGFSLVVTEKLAQETGQHYLWIYIYPSFYVFLSTCKVKQPYWLCHTKFPSFFFFHLSWEDIWEGTVYAISNFEKLSFCVIKRPCTFLKICDMVFLHPTFLDYHRKLQSWHLFFFMLQLLVVNSTRISTIIIYRFFPQSLLYHEL